MAHTSECGGLRKAGTGIEGFDFITGGGLPEGRTTLISGGPGSGKTVFALQTLLAGVRRGEAGVFVTFQESPRQIMENAASCGWNLASLEKDKLVILDSRIRPNVFKAIELYFNGMLAGIRLVAAEMQAKNIVFDSVDALFSLLGHGRSERQEIFRLRDWLVESGLTAIITAQVDRDDVVSSQRHGFLEFAADCVVSLHQNLAGTEPARSLRMVKYRGSGFVEREISFCIGSSGIKIAGEIAKPNKPKATSKLQREIAANQAAFQARIRSLTHQLEIKQAELDFLRDGKGKTPLPLRVDGAVQKPRKNLRNTLKKSPRRTA
ncbi:MAG TPA: ATPase domain-containing protein [Verrucomicrobiae bacterium]|nr:ATPase domain-containing protein [Verrucomicrobiae bacterium]